ncbi:Putative Phytoene synthase OS=Streptomyces glaucescens OX=1907 GN=crtB PE=4 SV=1 [Streptomyces glaucescens]
MVRAVADTARRYAIDHAHFHDFMTAMCSDLVVTDYPTYADLRGYTHGSAAVIGLQMLPVLGTVVPRAQAAPHAAALGVAFQLTNFLRDVGEDLDRGRVYLPADLLAGHGGRPGTAALEQGHRPPGPPRHRRPPGVRGAHPRRLPRRRHRVSPNPVSRPCIRTAYVLYGGILDAVARDGYAVLHRRSVVPRRNRAAVAADGLVRVAAARLRHRGAARHPASGAPDTPPASAPAARPTVLEEVA